MIRHCVEEYVGDYTVFVGERKRRFAFEVDVAFSG
jgi:hypothetical protein